MNHLLENFLSWQKKKKLKSAYSWEKTRNKSKWKIILSTAILMWLFNAVGISLISYFYSQSISFFLLVYIFIFCSFLSLLSGWSHWRSMEKNYQQYLKEKAEEDRKLKWQTEFMAKK